LKTKRRNEILLFSVNVLARIPFLNAGYGREEDAWSQALNAKIISETGVYEVSRLPGHPLYEVLLSLLWPLDHSYFLYNSLSTLVSALSVVLFYRIAKQLQLKSALTLGLTLGFIPVVFISGVYTIDYNFALLFILLSYYKLLQNQVVWAGVLLGIATGFRISSLGFILPWILLYPHPKNWPFLFKLGLSSFIIATLSFSPALLTYGMGFLDFHKPPYASWAKIIFKLTFGIWGLLLFLYLLLTTAFRSLKYKAKVSTPQYFKWSLLIIVGMQLFVFFRLPFKSEFLIPALPFLLLFFGYYLTQNQLKILPYIAILSCFLFGFDYVSKERGSPPSEVALQFEAGGKSIFIDPIQGPAMIDYRKRLVKMNFVTSVLSWMEKQEKPIFLIAGWYWPQIVLRQKAETPHIKVDYLSTENELNEAYGNGYSIFYLPEINEENHKSQSHYLADSLGTLLNP
jgi:hypothetical protein